MDRLSRRHALSLLLLLLSPAGVSDRGYGMGAAVGDYDGDGRPDLYVTNYGRNTLSGSSSASTAYPVAASCMNRLWFDPGA